VIAAARARVLHMHSPGTVEDMASYQQASYASVVDEVCDELSAAVDAARGAGIADEAIVVDPGLGFSKRTEHSIALLARIDGIAALGYPVLVGPSRKRFLAGAGDSVPAGQRVPGTVAACCIAYIGGARIFRVHDVAPVRQALDVTAACVAARELAAH
jgi:dihydropteroate synthase